MISELEMFPTSGNEEERTMQEKVIKGHRIVMPVLLLEIVGYVAAIAGVILGAVYEIVPLIVACVVFIALAWILLPGMKVLKPQEALVLTLFGKYVATMRGTIS